MRTSTDDHGADEGNGSQEALLEKLKANPTDAALRQLQQVLKTDPKNAKALFNLGMMKWKGKDDAAGHRHLARTAAQQSKPGSQVERGTNDC